MTQIDTSTEAVEQLLKDVTPGPWQVESDKDYETPDGFERLHLTSQSGTTVVGGCGCCGSPYGGNAKDTHFIRAARNLVPALLKERDEARARAAAAFEMAVIHLRNWQNDLIASRFPDMGVAVGMAADVIADLATDQERDALAKVRAEAMREAAGKATSFLVGDPQNGIPLRKPMAHEVADAILARADQIEKGEL